MRVRESDPLSKIEYFVKVAGEAPPPAAALAGGSCPNCRRRVRPAARMCWCGYRLQVAPAAR